MTNNIKNNSDKSDSSINESNKLGSVFISVNASIVKASVNYSKANQDKLVVIAEKQTDHIIRMQKELLKEFKKDKQTERKLVEAKVLGQIKYTLRGQGAALIVFLAGLSFCAFLTYLGHSLLGFVGVIVSIGTIASQFLGKNTSNSTKKSNSNIKPRK